MTKKESNAAQEVQEATANDFEQMALYDMPAEKDDTAAIIADIAETLTMLEAGYKYNLHDFECKLDEIKLMTERQSTPGAMAVICEEAADAANAFFQSTGRTEFVELSWKFEALAQTHSVQAAVLKGIPQAPAKECIVHTPEYTDPETGEKVPEREFSLPAELEEYRKYSPYAASLYEQEINDAEPSTAQKKAANVFKDLADMIDKAKQNNPGNTPLAAMNTLADIAEFTRSASYQAIKETVAEVKAFLDEHAEEIKAAATAGIPEDIKSLLPFIRAELEELRADPEQQSYNLADVLKLSFDANGKPTASPFEELIERAKKRKADYDTAKTLIEEIPRIQSKLLETAEYPLDKVNKYVWDLIKGLPANGQLKFATEANGSKKEATVLYAIYFDELENELPITKRLTPFDKRCYIAASSLYNCGNTIMTATQIYTAMGNISRPSPKDIEKINASLTKMGAARVYIDNSQEITVNKDYPEFKYDAPLLPFERCSAYINGQLCEFAIKLYREPPLITFARGRKQITTIPVKLLTAPVNKTENNLRIDDYLIERISHIKRGGERGKKQISKKLLYSTIFERCGITDRKQKQRAKETIKRYLNHYATCNFIQGYKEETDGIIIQDQANK